MSYQMPNGGFISFRKQLSKSICSIIPNQLESTRFQASKRGISVRNHQPSDAISLA
jgi:hypothetical protein